MERLKPREFGVAPRVLAALGVVLLASVAMVYVFGRGFGYDFAAYDDAARRIVHGESLYLSNTAELYRQQQFKGLYLYPPPLAAALIPLTVLTIHDARIVWLVLGLALLVGGCWIMPVGRTARLLTLTVAFASHPVLSDLNLGNISIVVFAFSALAWRMTDRPIGALAHAALIAIRFPFAVFFVKWLIERRARAIVLTIGAGLLLILVSLPIVGLSTYQDYVTILRGLPDTSTGAHNLSLKSTALRAGIPAGLAALAVPAGYVVGIVAIAYSARRRDPDVAFVVCAVATLLVSPFIHPHYLTVLLLPTALLVDRGHLWALALPLLGWLPGALLPLLAPLTIGVLLLIDRRARIGLGAGVVTTKSEGSTQPIGGSGLSRDIGATATPSRKNRPVVVTRASSNPARASAASNPAGWW